jgi:uncharacterized DUF497 family protein
MGKTIVSSDGLFEWDEEKSMLNRKKHGLAFEEILPVFDDPNMIEYFDASHSTDTENRMQGIGMLQGVLTVYVCYMERNGRTRIYSARKTTSGEEKKYHERLKSIIA